MLKSASKRTTFNCEKSNQLLSRQTRIEAEIERTLCVSDELQRRREVWFPKHRSGLPDQLRSSVYERGFVNSSKSRSSRNASSFCPHLRFAPSKGQLHVNNAVVPGTRTITHVTTTPRLPSSTTVPKPLKLSPYKQMRVPPPLKRPLPASTKADENRVTTNSVGVQLLSRPLHAQIFRNAKFPTPSSIGVKLSQSHLQSHGLDISQAQKLPNLSFTLPPLEGHTIDSHFWNIGSDIAGPSKELAKALSAVDTPPLPEDNIWQHRAGWTRYSRIKEDSEWKIEHNVGPYEETQLVFDVETMPKEHHYAIMACAVSPSAWYCWVSPWLLGESKDPAHLIPLGPPLQDGQGGLKERVVVGHNVAYDRARVLEEYDLKQTSGIRWIDTMALHVAVKGISSVQRPAWMAWNKEEKIREKILSQSTTDEDADDVNSTESPLSEARLSADLEREMEFESALESEEESDLAYERWESITSVNSLLEVAKLYCGIKMNKEIRNAFMSDTPAQIRNELTKYISYCAMDVYTTHAVFRQVLPLFFKSCPHPVSWAGVMQMGSSFLTVNQEWEKYLERAEAKFRELEGDVKGRLRELAEEAKGLMENGGWEGDIFLEQLDWTPKVAGKSRGFWVPTQKDLKVIEQARLMAASKPKVARKAKQSQVSDEEQGAPLSSQPKWYQDLHADPSSHHCRHFIIPLLLQVKWNKMPMFYSPEHGWLYRHTTCPEGDVIVSLSPSDPIKSFEKPKLFFVKPGAINPNVPLWSLQGVGKTFGEGVLSTVDNDLALSLLEKHMARATHTQLLKLADRVIHPSRGPIPLAFRQLEMAEPQQLDDITSEDSLTEGNSMIMSTHSSLPPGISPPDGLRYPAPVWPKWYWDLAKPRKDAPRGEIDITVKSRLTPLLLRLGWLGNPLFYSRDHGWCYGVRPRMQEEKPEENSSEEAKAAASRSPAVEFKHPDDFRWRIQSVIQDYQFFKLPHAHGQDANVGNPLSKNFIKYAQDGTLKSLAKTGAAAGVEVASTGAIMIPAADEAKNALDMNSMCSYWISARDRVLNQVVVWEKEKGDLGLGRVGGPATATMGEKWGMILPQVITMGTVTRRAIEKTWLTASNAKKNRVGSELKAMVRAPRGYAIVGADVDSEELWISSVMGDAQFGMHGATAIGWMTLEGTKKAGTDLHSKTASILKISRDSAKVFNYSRIYGAGMRHAILLLLQANPGMSTAQAQKLAEDLYTTTKGKNTHTMEHFGRKFWYGGTESFLFNKLESIALSDTPMTPALGCGVTSALSKKHLPEGFGADYLPSRINWVVQSSGVDYLHLLITSMERLIEKYAIRGRYMISVHDEVRYLVKEEDKYRAALALQIANLWTRSLFAYRLGLDDLPASVGFFSAVDVDWVLRKEVDMECITPSQPIPLAPGESLGIAEVLEKTRRTLHADGTPMEKWTDRESEPRVKEGYVAADPTMHRAEGPEFLRAQSTNQLGEVRISSADWAMQLKQMGREHELATWVKKKVTKERERRAWDMEMVAESVNISHESPSLDDLGEAMSGGNW